MNWPMPLYDGQHSSPVYDWMRTSSHHPQQEPPLHSEGQRRKARRCRSSRPCCPTRRQVGQGSSSPPGMTMSAAKRSRSHPERVVVPAGHPGVAGPIGSGSRPRRKARSASLLQHRHNHRARRHHRPVRPPMADRSHVRRNARSPGRRDTAPMDRQSYRSNHAGTSRILQPHLAVGL